MLEEALKNPSSSHEEATNALLSFLRTDLVQGGTNTEARFLRLFPTLIQRLFSERKNTNANVNKTTTRSNDNAYDKNYSSSMNFPWMVQTYNKTRNNYRKDVSSTMSHIIPQQYDTQSHPLYQLLTSSNNGRGKSALSQQQSLWDAIEAEMEHRPSIRLSCPLSTFPASIRRALVGMFQSNANNSTYSQNSIQLVQHWMSSTDQTELHMAIHREQQALWRQQQQKQPQQGFIASPKSPKQMREPNHTTDSIIAALEGAPVKLTMMEYFLLYFVRFATLRFPNQNNVNNRSHLQTRRMIHSQNNAIYQKLFEEYLHTHQSTFILRLVMEYWMDNNKTLVATNICSEQMQVWAQRHHLSSTQLSKSLSIYDLTQSPSSRSQPILITPVLCSAINYTVKYILKNMNVHNKQIPTLLWEFQLSFYNYLRIGFKFSTSNQNFMYFVNLWLLWIEPWKYVKTNESHHRSANNDVDFSNAKHFILSTTESAKQLVRTHTIDHVHHKKNKKYNSRQWHHFVAANLHLYTVPFCIFVRRARELDFSFKKNIFDSIQRVWNVFIQEELLHTLEIETNKYLSPHMNDDTTLSQQHRKILGPYAPPVTFNWKIDSLKDMKLLLEEMHHQLIQSKIQEQNSLDRFVNKVEGFIVGNGTFSSAQNSIEKIVEQARLILSWDESDYQVWKEKCLGNGEHVLLQKKFSKKNENVEPERVAHILTDKGREQILNGVKQCSALQIASIGTLGDPMYRRVKSFEIELLVQFWVSVSEWLNEKVLGISSSVVDNEPNCPSSTTNQNLMHLYRQTQQHRKLRFRFNLRFLADSRNFLLLFFACTFFSSIF